MKKENVSVKKGCHYKKCVILNLIQDLQRLPWQLVNNLRGRSRIKYGMTPDLMGFTLIELLVVVLIIGILAAVAVPQYKKAVMKARATEAIGNLYKIHQAQRVYHLTNGTYADNLTTLDIDFPTEHYTYFCYGDKADCYAASVVESYPGFEMNSNKLWCRGTEKECQPFSTQQDPNLGAGYWVIRELKSK